MSEGAPRIIPVTSERGEQSPTFGPRPSLAWTGMFADGTPPTLSVGDILVSQEGAEGDGAIPETGPKDAEPSLASLRKVLGNHGLEIELNERGDPADLDHFLGQAAKK